MKLSEAINLGAVTVKMDACNMNSCAFGAALNAVGVPQEEIPCKRYTPLIENWPWLGVGYRSARLNDLAVTIYSMFDSEVCKGKKTLEQLVDYVASIEPSCGYCNRFDCTCAKAETADAPVEVLVATEGRE